MSCRYSLITTSNKPKQQVNVRSAAVRNLKKRRNSQQAPNGNKKDPIKFGANPTNGFHTCGICTNGRIKNLMAQINNVPVIMIHFETVFMYMAMSFANESKKPSLQN